MYKIYLFYRDNITEDLFKKGTQQGGVIPEQPYYINLENDPETVKTNVKLPPCQYKISVFKDCVYKKMHKDPSFKWTIWHNCKDFILETISECRKKSMGCEKQ